MFFEGESILNTELPAHYLLTWFSVTLPEFFLVAIVAGLLAVVMARRGDTANVERSERAAVWPLQMGMVVFAVVFPLAYTAVTTPTIYDGIRHFLFVLPPLAVVAGVGLAALIRGSSPKWLRVSVVGLVVLSMAATAVTMVRLHPYQYVYFNPVVAGGLDDASERFETEYWGASYKEAVEWLVENYDTAGAEGIPKVASCLFSTSTSHFLPTDRFEYIGSFDNGQMISGHPDVLLATTRWGCAERLPGRTVHSVTRLGVPLLHIIEVEPLPVEDDPGGAS